MRFVSIPMKGIGAPTQEQVSKVLSVLEDSDSWPVFVHCRRGSDRTGTVLACYRISHDHWKNQKALEEAKTYGLSSFERAMRRLTSSAFKPLAVSFSYRFSYPLCPPLPFKSAYTMLGAVQCRRKHFSSFM